MEERGEFKSVPGANDDIVWAGLTLMNETGKEAKGPERPLGAAEAKLWTELGAGAPHPLMGPTGGCEGKMTSLF